MTTFIYKNKDWEADFDIICKPLKQNKKKNPISLFIANL